MNIYYERVIKQLRSKMILSQVEFAELLGIAFSTVNSWKSGLYAPKIKAKRKLSTIV